MQRGWGARPHTDTAAVCETPADRNRHHQGEHQIGGRYQRRHDGAHTSAGSHQSCAAEDHLPRSHHPCTEPRRGQAQSGHRSAGTSRIRQLADTCDHQHQCDDPVERGEQTHARSVTTACAHSATTTDRSREALPHAGRFDEGLESSWPRSGRPPTTESRLSREAVLGNSSRGCDLRIGGVTT